MSHLSHPRLRVRFVAHRMEADRDLRERVLRTLDNLSLGPADATRAVVVVECLEDGYHVALRAELDDGSKAAGEATLPCVEEALEMAARRLEDDWSRNDLESISDEINRGPYESWRKW